MSRLPLPDPEEISARLRDTRFAQELVGIAQNVLARRIPLLGYEVKLEGEIRWRRDPVSRRETEPVYFRRIPYLDFARAGDHKLIWELNRHQHLVALAQASLLSGREDFLHEIWMQLESWLDQNPVSCGINWASALEVAFRALSWIWIHHLAGDRVEPKLAARWLRSLYHHGCFLERNLSIYFSPNTHLQGEALALHALGILFGVRRWRTRGAALMAQMISEHVHADGGHFEQSSYYHVYAMDMFLFHAVLEPVDESFREALRRMARYLWALAGSGEMPFLGDDDGGRLFYPFGERSGFARATLAACAALLGDTPSHGDADDLNEIAVWWLGNRAVARPRAQYVSEVFRETGVAVMNDGNIEVIAAVRAFGRGSAGHSHAHGLHFMLKRAGEAVLIDPGTYTYVCDPAWRDRFRGTAAHNTIRIDGRDQADPAGPFRWSNPARAEILDWQERPWRLHARCSYRDLSHERKMIFAESALWVVDEIRGSGRHRIEQFWHPAGPVERLEGGSVRLSGGFRLVSSHPMEIGQNGEHGWRSPVPGVKHPAPIIRVGFETELPCRLVAVFDLCEGMEALAVEEDRLSLGGRQIRL